MKIIQLVGTLLERHLTENTRAEVEKTKALNDYNIMMGNLEEPISEDEETEGEIYG